METQKTSLARTLECLGSTIHLAHTVLRTSFASLTRLGSTGYLGRPERERHPVRVLSVLPPQGPLTIMGGSEIPLG